MAFDDECLPKKASGDHYSSGGRLSIGTLVPFSSVSEATSHKFAAGFTPALKEFRARRIISRFHGHFWRLHPGCV
jgi:hypothetical protein